MTLIGLSIGIYVYANYIASDNVSTAGVKNVEPDSSILEEHIKNGRISGETFYGQLLPSWDLLSKEKRQEYLQKVLQVGTEKAYKQVNLINKDGKMVAYASATRLDVVMP